MNSPHLGHLANHIGTDWPHLHFTLWRITEELMRLPLVPAESLATESSSTEEECPTPFSAAAAARSAAAARWTAVAVSFDERISGTRTKTCPLQKGQRPFFPAYLSLTLNSCPWGHFTAIPMFGFDPLLKRYRQPHQSPTDDARATGEYFTRQ